MSELYQGEKGRLYHEGKRAIPEAAFGWVAALRAEKFRDSVKAGDVVFEYGVGYGWNLAGLCCARKVGFDVADFLRPEVERRGIEFVRETRGVGDGFADVVICHHTLEHVPNPGETLAEIKRLLKPGGVAIVTVPLEKESRYHRFDPAEPNHHLFSWNAQSLGNLLLHNGYTMESVRVQRYGYDRFAATKAAQLGGGARLYRTIRALAMTFRGLLEVHAVARIGEGTRVRPAGR